MPAITITYRQLLNLSRRPLCPCVSNDFCSASPPAETRRISRVPSAASENHGWIALLDYGRLALVPASVRGPLIAAAFSKNQTPEWRQHGSRSSEILATLFFISIGIFVKCKLTLPVDLQNLYNSRNTACSRFDRKYNSYCIVFSFCFRSIRVH